MAGIHDHLHTKRIFNAGLKEVCFCPPGAFLLVDGTQTLSEKCPAYVFCAELTHAIDTFSSDDKLCCTFALHRKLLIYLIFKL